HREAAIAGIAELVEHVIYIRVQSRDECRHRYEHLLLRPVDPQRDRLILRYECDIAAALHDLDVGRKPLEVLELTQRRLPVEAIHERGQRLVEAAVSAEAETGVGAIDLGGAGLREQKQGKRRGQKPAGRDGPTG